MSLFFLSDNKKDSDNAKKMYEKLDFCVTQIMLTEFNRNYDERVHCWSVISVNDRERDPIVKVYEDKKVILFGTIFNKNKFNLELMESFPNGEEFICAVTGMEQTIYGNFNLIVYDIKNEELSIIQDRMQVMNVFYPKSSKCMCVGDDLLAVSKFNQLTELDMQTVFEFITTNYNLGNETIFKNVHRVGWGNKLVFRNEHWEEVKCYDYRIEHLTMDEYCERFAEYFKLINNYHGKVGVDLSGGHDTRMLVSVASKILTDYGVCTNRTTWDNGGDIQISKVIADILGKKQLYLDSNFENFEKTEKKQRRMLHISSVMRDSYRSQILPYVASQRYKNFDLIISGHGGEVIRTKYNKHSNIDEYVMKYCGGETIVRNRGPKDYIEKAYEKLRRVPVFEEMDKNLLFVWFYLILWQRIWGTAFIHCMTMYGENIHPMMDWYLLSPVFGFSSEELDEAELMKAVVNRFGGEELASIPYNMPILNNSSIKRRVRTGIGYLKRKLGFMGKYRRKKELIKYYKENKNRLEIPKDMLTKEMIEYCSLCEDGVMKRAKTVIMAYDEVMEVI